MHNRQGRAAQFKTAKERDEWISKERKSLASAISTRKKQIDRINEEINRLEEAISSEQDILHNKTKMLEDHRKTQESCNADLADLTDKRDKAANQRKELWRTEAEANATLLQLKEGSCLPLVSYL